MVDKQREARYHLERALTHINNSTVELNFAGHEISGIKLEAISKMLRHRVVLVDRLKAVLIEIIDEITEESG